MLILRNNLTQSSINSRFDFCSQNFIWHISLPRTRPSIEYGDQYCTGIKNYSSCEQWGYPPFLLRTSDACEQRSSDKMCSAA